LLFCRSRRARPSGPISTGGYPPWPGPDA
jgi:hypothetical protein